MENCVEKIYCCDRGDNDNALAAAILANNNNNNRYGYGDFGVNNWMNNPFAYLMFLALFRNGGFGFGDGNGVATQGIVSSIRNEPEDWQNRDGSRCYYRGQWKNGNLRYS